MLLTEYDEALQMKLFWEEGFREGFREGFPEGIQRGEDMLAALISKLYSLGRGADVARAANDAACRQALLREFGIDA